VRQHRFDLSLPLLSGTLLSGTLLSLNLPGQPPHLKCSKSIPCYR